MSGARLWIWWHGSPCRIALKDKQTIELFECYQHEEGWTRLWVRYTRLGDVIEREEACDGTDCDGRHFESAVSSVDLENLQERLYEGVPWPGWQRETVQSRDYAAEAAGY